jgi:tetratricopeptide (TPR) repeat protein
MSQNPRDVEARALQAQKAGEYRVAIELWRAIIELQPNWEHGYAHYYLADCYIMVGDSDRAEQEYRRAIDLAPQDELFSIALQSLVDARRSGVL